MSIRPLDIDALSKAFREAQLDAFENGGPLPEPPTITDDQIRESIEAVVAAGKEAITIRARNKTRQW